MMLYIRMFQLNTFFCDFAKLFSLICKHITKVEPIVANLNLNLNNSCRFLYFLSISGKTVTLSDNRNHRNL